MVGKRVILGPRHKDKERFEPACRQAWGEGRRFEGFKEGRFERLKKGITSRIEITQLVKLYFGGMSNRLYNS